MMVMKIMTRERHRKMLRPNFCLSFIWDFWRTRMGMLTTVSEGNVVNTLISSFCDVVFGEKSGYKRNEREKVTHYISNDV